MNGWIGDGITFVGVVTVALVAAWKDRPKVRASSESTAVRTMREVLDEVRTQHQITIAAIEQCERERLSDRQDFEMEREANHRKLWEVQEQLARMRTQLLAAGIVIDLDSSNDQG